VSRCIGLSGSDRKFPALTGRLGTSPAVAYDGWHFGALVLVTTSRATHYERVTCVARQVPKPALASRSRVAAAGGRWLLTAVRGHLGGTPCNA